MERIKKKTIYFYRFYFLKDKGKYKKKLDCKFVYFYDRQGRSSKTLYFDIYGKKKLMLALTEIFKYNAKGQLVAREYYAAKGWLKERVVYKYNQVDNTKQIESVRYDYWGRVKNKFRGLLRYDKSGNLIWERWTRQGTYYLTTYEYDKKNRLIKKKYETRLKETCYVHEYKYQGVRVIQIVRNDNEYMFSRESYIDVDGREIEVEKRIGEGNQIKSLRCRYKENRVTFEIHKEFNYDGSLQRIGKGRYNKYGHIIYQEEIKYYCDCTGVEMYPGLLGTYEYEYY